MFDFGKFIASGEKYKFSKNLQYLIAENLWDKEFLNKINDDINTFTNWDGIKKFYGSDWWVKNVDFVRSHLAHRDILTIESI